MQTYWAIVMEKAQKPHNAGVRGIVVELPHGPQEERFPAEDR